MSDNSLRFRFCPVPLRAGRPVPGFEIRMFKPGTGRPAFRGTGQKRKNLTALNGAKNYGNTVTITRW